MTKKKSAALLASVIGAAVVVTLLIPSGKPPVHSWFSAHAPDTLAFIPAAPEFTSLQVSNSRAILEWVGGKATVEFTYDPGWTWGAITNAESPVIVPATYSNGFYRLAQSPVKVTKWPVTTNDAVYWDKRPFAGDNNIAFIAHGDVVSCLSNGVVSQVILPKAIPQPEYCSTDCIAYDPATQRLYTLYNQCFYGHGCPCTFVEYQLSGTNGHFTTATVVSMEEGFGEYGDTVGDMMLTEAGGIVVCWKSTSKNYAFQYRSPAGQWRPVFYETNIAQRVTHMRLGQHPDAGIWAFLSRDGMHEPVPTIHFHESAGRLVYDWTMPTFNQEGEFPVVTSIRDDQAFTLKVARATDPYHGFVWAEGGQGIFRKGSAFGVVDLYGGGELHDSEMYPAKYGNYSEPVATHAACLANGTVWVVRQEWNYLTGNFDLVYAVTYNGAWGERTFFYQAQQNGNFRGGATSTLSSYYNCDPNPNWALFTNDDERGVYCIYQINQ